MEKDSLITWSLASVGECYEDQFVRIDQQGITLKLCYLSAKRVEWAKLSKIVQFTRKDLHWYQFKAWGGCGNTWWACDVKRRRHNRSLIVLIRPGLRYRLGATVLDAEAALAVIMRFAPSLLQGLRAEIHPATAVISNKTV